MSKEIKSDIESIRSSSPAILLPAQEVVDFVASLAGRRVIDVGGGTGGYSYALNSMGHRCLVVDTDMHHLKEAKSKGVDVARMDAENLAIRDRSFDTALLVEVIEHVSDFKKVLREVRRVAKRNVLLTTPNHDSYFWLKARGLYTQATLPCDHRHFFTKASLERLLAGIFPSYRVLCGEPIRLFPFTRPIASSRLYAECTNIERIRPKLSPQGELRENCDPPVGALDLIPISPVDFERPNFASTALRRLQEIYSSRPDLQSSYPEARRGNYGRLLDWASKVVSGIISDSSRDILASFDLFGMQRILDEMNIQLQNQSRAFSDERAALTTKLQELETEKAHLSEKLDRLSSEFSLNESSLRSLEAETTKLEMRLTAAKVAYENELTETKISKYAEAARLQAQLVSKDAEVARLQAQLVSKNTEAAELKGQLDLIAASTTWKLIGVARRFEEKHLPPSSDRGRQFKHLINSVNRVVSRMLR